MLAQHQMVRNVSEDKAGAEWIFDLKQAKLFVGTRWRRAPNVAVKSKTQIT